MPTMSQTKRRGRPKGSTSKKKKTADVSYGSDVDNDYNRAPRPTTVKRGENSGVNPDTGLPFPINQEETGVGKKDKKLVFLSSSVLLKVKERPMVTGTQIANEILEMYRQFCDVSTLFILY